MNVYGQKVYLIDKCAEYVFYSEMIHMELEDTRKQILIDCRNNSAFAHRHHLLHLNHDHADADADEIHFCMEIIQLTPHNESVWNYVWSFDRCWISEGFIELVETCLIQDPLNVYALESKLKICNGMDDVFDKLIEADTVRSSYWTWRKKKHQQQNNISK